MVSGLLAVFQGYYFNRVRGIVGTHDQVAVRSFDVPDDASARLSIRRMCYFRSCGMELNALEKKLLAMNVLEEYSIPEVARLLGGTQRTVERFLQDAPDQLSRIPLAGGLMEQLPSVTEGSKTSPEGRNYNFDLSDTNQGGNIEKLAVHPPLI
jgi:hypothetical protein